MSHSASTSPRQTLLYVGIAAVLLILLLIWIEGGFEPKTPPGLSQTQAAELPSGGRTARVERRDTDEVFSWPGTITALTVVQVAPKLSGRIIEVTVRAGNPVRRGQVLARLDASEIQARLGQARAALGSAEAEAQRVRAQASEGQARLGQARAALVAAEAESERARADAARIESLYGKEAATRQDLDAARAAAAAGEAQVMRARDGIREAESHVHQTLHAAIIAADAMVAQARDGVRAAESQLADTVLRAPVDSIVVKRNQEPGDMALPGVPVLTLQQSGTLRVEAAIPANCGDRLQVGSPLAVRLGTASQSFAVLVDEIQPAADPSTRTVLVKARLPDTAEARPGAFAWLQQPCGRISALLIPAAAVSRIGQLESVRLIVDGRPRVRQIRTGKRHGDAVEVLSGLSEGDLVQLPGDLR